MLTTPTKIMKFELPISLLAEYSHQQVDVIFHHGTYMRKCSWSPDVGLNVLSYKIQFLYAIM